MQQAISFFALSYPCQSIYLVFNAQASHFTQSCMQSFTGLLLRDTITITGTVACKCQLVPSTGKEWDEVEPLCINCSHYLMMHSIHGEIAQTILGPCGIPSFFVLLFY